MRTAWLAAVLLGVAAEARPAQDVKSEVKRGDFRYDRKSFDEWRSFLRTELKAELRIEGLHALSVFGAHGYAREAAETVLEVALKHIKVDGAERKKAKGAAKGFGKGARPDGGEQGDREVMLKARRSLGVIGPAAAALLVESLKDRDGAVRLFAVSTLYGEFDALPPSAVPALLRVLQDEHPEVRLRAVQSLESRFDALPPDAVPALLQAVQDEGNSVSLIAVQAVFRADKSFAAIRKAAQDDKLARGLAAALTRLLTNNSDMSRAYTEPVATLFGALGPRARESVPALVDIVKGQEVAGNRLGAVMALGEVAADAKAAVPALTELFQRDAGALRPYAAVALAKFGPEAKAALPALLELAKEKGADVLSRFTAAVASDCIRDPSEKAFPLFVPLLKEVTAPQLWNPGGPGGFPKKKAAKGGGKAGFDKGVGGGGFSGFERVDRGAIVRALLVAYGQFGVHRVAIAETLGGLGAEAVSALPVLEQALEAIDPEVRRAAAAAIQRIRPQN